MRQEDLSDSSLPVLIGYLAKSPQMLFPAKKIRILDIIETLPEIIKISLFISDSKITDSSQENNERNDKIILKSCKLLSLKKDPQQPHRSSGISSYIFILPETRPFPDIPHFLRALPRF